MCKRFKYNQIRQRRLLNFEQKQRHMDIAQEILTTLNEDPDLFKKVITCNESWVYVYDIETKGKSSQEKGSEENIQKNHVTFGQM